MAKILLLRFAHAHEWRSSLCLCEQRHCHMSRYLGKSRVRTKLKKLSVPLGFIYWMEVTISCNSVYLCNAVYVQGLYKEWLIRPLTEWCQGRVFCLLTGHVQNSQRKRCILKSWTPWVAPELDSHSDQQQCHWNPGSCTRGGRVSTWWALACLCHVLEGEGVLCLGEGYHSLLSWFSSASPLNGTYVWRSWSSLYLHIVLCPAHLPRLVLTPVSGRTK